jgi:Protein of unknown function (DUF995)
MIDLRRGIAVTFLALSLGACAMNSGPAPDVAVQEQPTGLSQAQIRTAFSGKSWNWASPKNSGQTLYAADGTSLVEVKGKGTTTGKWMAKDGQLCESYAPAPFLPKGAPMSCQSVTGSDGSYQVGQATFTPA